jgi:hypothetical protein
MLYCLLILLAALLLLGKPVMESLVTTGSSMEYMVAICVAMLLKPWSDDQFS